MSSIVLVGFMGAGKTAVGNMLARRLGKSFIDVDLLIEEKSGLTINEVFDRHGEPYFRRIESEMIADISKSDDLIVAAGGGAVVDDSNLANLQKMGHLIYLSARPEVIHERTKHKHHRPLLETEDRRERIAHLLEQRRPYYARADYEIDTSNLTVEDVVERIVMYLRELHHG